MRITSVDFVKFKQFKSANIDLRKGVTIVAGGNNAGKSSLLQGLAVWEFCKTATIAQRGREGLLKVRGTSQGFGIGDDEFSPINLPSLKHLWHELRPQKGDDDEDGYTLAITLHWEDSSNAAWHLGFRLALANDRLFIKVSASNLSSESAIPVIAYLPPFAGITAREERIKGAARRRRIGEGLAGAVLRNLLLDMRDANLVRRENLRGDRTKISDTDLRALRNSDPWELLQQTMREVFGSELILKEFDEEYHTYIQASVDKGKIDGYRLTRTPRYVPRDLMVEGSGFLQWLSVYTLATSPDADVLLFDEPDAHLHAALQTQLFERLENLAGRFEKQVMLATHSPEIIRTTPLPQILEIRSRAQARYLTTEDQKVGMMVGIGSSYAPRLDNIRTSKKVFFFEGSSDVAVLKEIARITGKKWPRGVPEWQTPQTHKERMMLWRALRSEYGDIRALSLRDRDEDSPNTVDQDFRDKSHGHNETDFMSRKWRRRHLESYLVVPSAIAKARNISLADVEKVLENEYFLVINESYYKSEASAPILDLRGKEILARFNLKAIQVAKILQPDQVCEDLKEIAQQVVNLG